MGGLICPKCGYIESDPSARYCDIDGARLVSRPEPIPTSASLQPVHASASATSRTPSGGLPWGLPLIACGAVMLFTSVAIAATAGSALDLHPQQVQLVLSVSPTGGSGLEKIRGKLLDRFFSNPSSAQDERPTESR